MLVGLGLEAYRKGKALPEADREEAPENEGRGNAVPLFDLDPKSLPDLFRDFDKAMEPRKEKEEAGFRVIYPEDFRD